MQRLAGDFINKRMFTIYDKGGAVSELYELPNGQWQFGKGRDAQVITSLDQIEEVNDPGIRRDVEAWLERTKGQRLQPVQQGNTPLLVGETVKDRLSVAISRMPEHVAAQLLGSIEQILGPVADSLKAASVDDELILPPAAVPFSLPEGARWAQEGRPEAGYLVPDLAVRDEKGNPCVRWHPTPQFMESVEQATDKTAVELEIEAERELHQEMAVAGGSGRSRSSRRR